MTLEAILAFTLFAAIATGTPGPNNLMVMASGANFGLRRTLPHILGIAIGFAVMIALTAIRLAQVFTAVPMLRTALTVLSLLFLLYLAWKIATAAPPDPTAPPGNPLSFLQAAAFQWVNPKAWVMALTTASVYIAPGYAGLAAVIFALVALPLCALWAVAGEAVGRLLAQPRQRRIFNAVMATLLLATTLPTLL